jgi:hypothetical protein
MRSQLETGPVVSTKHLCANSLIGWGNPKRGSVDKGSLAHRNQMATLLILGIGGG